MVKKRLYFDIETSPNIGFFWSAGYKLNIGYENIIKERAIICICYKWSHEKKVNYLTWDSKQCDKKMLQAFIKVANEADEIVGHNGDKFDLVWIRTRCLFHGIPVFPSYVTIDTLKFARSKFKFNSNRLDYIGRFLGIGKKLKTGFDLWRDIALKKCPECMNKMVRYCKQDVKLLQYIHEKLINYLPAKTHYGVLNHGEKVSCPECGGPTRINLTKVTAAGIKKHQRVCKKCGKYHTTSAKSNSK